MKVKKLINSPLQKKSSNTAVALAGLAAGLAVGAVLGLLFAPDKGSATREKLTDKALDFTDNLKDGLHAIKDTVSSGKDSLIGMKNDVVDNLKSKANNLSQEYKEFRKAELDKVNISNTKEA